MSRQDLTIAGAKPAHNDKMGVIADRIQNLTTQGALGTSHVTGIDFFSVQLTPSSIVKQTTAEQTFTVNGLRYGSAPIVVKPTAQAGLGIVGARVSAENTLAITFSNVTAGTLTPTGGETYLIVALRSA